MEKTALGTDGESVTARAGGADKRAGRVSRGLIKAARNPVRAVRLLWPRFSPFTATTGDPAWRRQTRWSFGTLEREPLASVFPGIETTEVRIPHAFDRDDLLSMIPSEVMTLAAMVRFLQPRRVLQIGTFEGNTTLQLAANSPSDARVVTVDLPSDWDGEYARPVSAIDANTTPGSRGSQLRNSGLERKVRQIFEDSAKLDWKGIGPFDFILIDGCHTYDYVVSDTRQALEVISPGGVIVWHDYGMLEDVSRAVDETSKTMAVRAIEGTRLAVGFP